MNKEERKRLVHLGRLNERRRFYRLFECSHCGHTEDRDVNAAKNIAQRGWGMDGATHLLPAQGVT